jgi:hypothetical protein
LRLHVSDFTNFYRFYSIVLLGDLKARRWVVLQSEQVWWVSHSKRPRCKITKFGQDMLKFVKTVSTLLCHNTSVIVGFLWHCSQLKVPKLAFGESWRPGGGESVSGKHGNMQNVDQKRNEVRERKHNQRYQRLWSFLRSY